MEHFNRAWWVESAVILHRSRMTHYERMFEPRRALVMKSTWQRPPAFDALL
jgi:hypothetical protein